MSLRKHTPLHNKWHRRVEGQIRDVMIQHPEWFTPLSENKNMFRINSIAKRIVGEIVADGELVTKTEPVTPIADSLEGCDGCKMSHSSGGVMGRLLRRLK